MSSRVWVSSTLNSLKSIRLGGTSVTGPTVVHSRLSAVQEVTAIPSRSFFRFMGDPGKHLKNEIRFGNKPSELANACRWYSVSSDAQSIGDQQQVSSTAPVSSSEPSSTDVEKISASEPKIELDKLYKTLQLEVLAYEPSVLDSYQWFVITSATHLNIPVGRCWAPLKSDKYRFPLLKSAFVHKKHQVQYEVRTYHRFLTFHKLTGSTADTFLEYIERNLPEGVGLKVTKVEVQPLPEYLQKQTS